MDPHACLLSAESALADEDFDAFLDFMESYAAWRRAGGFEPRFGGMNGDEAFGILMHEYRSSVCKADL